MPEAWTDAVLGGLFIGLASAIVLLAHGRIAGISGLVRRVVVERKRDRGRWRAGFLIGLVAFGIATRMTASVPELEPAQPWVLIVAGLLVGYGTQLGTGCTSGHGVCGTSRASTRSIASVFVFLSFGALTVYLTRHLLSLG